METALAAAPDDPYRGHDGPLVLERGPATSPLFGAFFEAVQQAGYALTDDVNGFRQEGFAAVRSEHPPRPAACPRRRRTSQPALRRRNLEVRTSALVTGDHVRRPARDGRRVPGRRRAPPGRGRRGDPRRRRDQHAAAAPALRGRGSASTCASLGIERGPAPARRRARTSRTTSRSTSSTAAASRSRCSPTPPQRWRRPWIGVPVAVLPPRARARRTTSRPAGSCAATRTSTTRT